MDDRQRIAQAKETVQGVHVASEEKKKNTFPYHMQWVLVKKGGVGSKGGAPARGSISITMETGGDGFNQLWLRPVKEQIQIPAFVSRHNPQPIRVSIAVTFMRGNQSASHVTSAVTNRVKMIC